METYLIPDRPPKEGNQISVVNGLNLPKWDYMSLAVSPATTETYTFKLKGATGQTVAVVVVVYTDSTRATISTVTRTA